MGLKSAFIFLVLVSIALADNSNNCWKQAYGRGVGKPISSCGDLQKDGLLCYPYCKQGFTGVGPVCWQNCPAGFVDTGVDCLKPDSYGRGAGYVSDSECLNENPKGCEENGLLWYPVCNQGFHAAGCCICSPNCIDGMKDVGVSCQKQNYGRGAGVPLGCKSNEQYEGGLCYPYCEDGFYGEGPVCWETCPNHMADCGWLCTPTVEECTEELKAVIKDSTVLAEAIAQAIETGGLNIIQIIKDMGALAEELAYGICEAPTTFTKFLEQQN